MPLQRKILEGIGARYCRLSSHYLPLKPGVPPLRHKLASIRGQLPSLRERYLVDGAKGNMRLLAIQAESEAPRLATCRANPKK
ncbi:hypothetical protein PKB_5450 [Pseudomonas knackmussii B13]|uniref:Uncharacterized protein n=1 Tax=Pseudomonas knackmussii (strain DSM 6978 / CCUG 54928 / LMG 23759 / B13) TaxID=1301098 RepID=A0A024HNX2_PSEKB|nr:hypothetical protein PKB_5450 [Pseudomonas knackmussii B13]